MPSKLYCLYIHENKINKKIYVGITSQTPSQRWGKNGIGYSKGQDKFYNAIKKYGWDNFNHIILYTHLTKDQAELLEQEYIKKYNSIENGYNSREGGNISSPSLESRKRMSLAHIGKIHSQESKEKNSISNKGKHNRKHTEEEKKKISEKKKKKVICLNNNMVFSSIQEACQWCGLKNISSISKVCKGERATGGKHPITNEPLRWRFLEENI